MSNIAKTTEHGQGESPSVAEEAANGELVSHETGASAFAGAASFADAESREILNLLGDDAAGGSCCGGSCCSV